MPPKILSLVWYKVLPPKFGGQKGIAIFNKHLSRYCTLVCLSSKDNEDPGNLTYRLIPELPLGRKQVLNPFYWWKVSRTTKKEKPFLLILEHPYHGLAAFFARKHTRSGFALHAHNIESSRFRQIGKWWWRLLKYYEQWVYHRASFIIFKTEADSQFAIREFSIRPEKCLIIPYGVERPLIRGRQENNIRRQYNIREDEKLLLFAGTLDYEPNAKAVEDIFTELAPRFRAAGLRFRILICGRNKFPQFSYLWNYKDENVTMAGEQDSITPYLQAADVFINPVLSGGGIQTKNLDALAHNCNTVCFAAQSTGIPEEICGGKLRVVTDQDWEEFVQFTTLQASFRSSTPDDFFAHFDWNRLLQPLIRKLPPNE